MMIAQKNPIPPLTYSRMRKNLTKVEAAQAGQLQLQLQLQPQ